jgi:hypothetical protein
MYVIMPHAQYLQRAILVTLSPNHPTHHPFLQPTEASNFHLNAREKREEELVVVHGGESIRGTFFLSLPHFKK